MSLYTTVYSNYSIIEIVESIREQSDLSYTVSTELLRSILLSLVTAHKDLNVLVPSLINTLKVSCCFLSRIFLVYYL